MAGSRELNARERKRVYMHSTIFDNGGPTSKSIYAQNQQNDINQTLADSLKPRSLPSMDLPRPSDIQATQNAGHGVVIPSGTGVDVRCSERGPLRTLPSASVPRTSGPQALVDNGDVMPVLKSSGKDLKKEVIPQEFWYTDVNLQWHDPRNEMSRQNKNQNQEMSHQELKLKELSSEIFGASRMLNCSTNTPGADLLITEDDYLQVDSALNPYIREDRQKSEQLTAFDRFSHNLTSTALARDAGQIETAAPSVPLEEDPITIPRRRQEKNFSDLFGTQMGERRNINSREEITGTRTCSYLDARSEIAARNMDHWRPSQSDLQGQEMKERPHVDALRKEAELGSHVFENQSVPRKPRASTEEVQVSGNERVTWDTKELMQSESELARRNRLKDFAVAQTSSNRKFESLASQQVRRGMGGQVNNEEPQFSPRGGYPSRSNRLTDPPKAAGMAASGRPMTAKDCKLASLQSSIFG